MKKMTQFFLCLVKLVFLLTGLVNTGSAMAQSQGQFDQGATRLTLIAGAGSAFDDTYLILGLGGGYYLIDGLEIGLNWQTWTGGDPTINQLTPELTYVFRTRSAFHPYLGALYRRTFISGLDDLSAWGGRLGAYITTGPRYYLGFGAVHQRYLDCSSSEYNSCSSTYPEFVFAFSF